MKITQETLFEIKESIMLGMNVEETATKFNLSKSTIRKYIKQDFKIYESKFKEYRKDLVHDYFKTIDSHAKAYFLGFIAGDGNVRDSMIRIRIVKTDEEVINRFKEQIKYHGNNNYVKQKNGKEQIHLVFRSINMINDLAKHGIIENKTFSLRLPNINEEFMSSYLLGFFDADGSIFYTKFTRKTGYRKGEVVEKYRFDITTNSILANEIALFLNTKLNTSLKVYQNKKNENVSSIQVSKNKDMVLLQTYLYSNYKLSLKRKADKFVNAVNFYKEGCSTTIICES